MVKRLCRKVRWFGAKAHEHLYMSVSSPSHLESLLKKFSCDPDTLTLRKACPWTTISVPDYALEFVDSRREGVQPEDCRQYIYVIFACMFRQGNGHRLLQESTRYLVWRPLWIVLTLDKSAASRGEVADIGRLMSGNKTRNVEKPGVYGQEYPLPAHPLNIPRMRYTGLAGNCKVRHQGHRSGVCSSRSKALQAGWLVHVSGHRALTFTQKHPWTNGVAKRY
jgi:hypothetical protein